MSLAEETYYRLDFKDETISADQRPSDYKQLLKSYLDREFETDDFEHFEYTEDAFDAYIWRNNDLIKCSVIFNSKSIIILVRS